MELDFRRLFESAPGRYLVLTPDFTIADGLTANADRRLLQIVFENLLGNAWKFTAHAADPHVEVGGDEAAFFVRDNGAGFDDAYASKLFAPFQRLHAEREFAGTGIGQGATIHFTLPAA